MNTKTINEPFDAITFELTELQKYWKTIEDCPIVDGVIAAAIDFSKAAADQPEAREMLLSTLGMMLFVEGKDMPVFDTRLVMLRQVMASVCRAVGNFYDAERLVRREPTKSVSTLVRLASDIRAQNDPSRLHEALSIYMKALMAGYDQLEHAIWPSKVPDEIASVWAGMASLQLEMDLPGAAQTNVENLMIFNTQCVADFNMPNGAAHQMLELFKQIMDYFRHCARKGNWQRADVLQRKIAPQLASLILKQTNYDEKVVQALVEAWGYKLETLVDMNPSLFGENHARARAAADDEQSRRQQAEQEHGRIPLIEAVSFPEVELRLTLLDTAYLNCPLSDGSNCGGDFFR